MLTEDQQKLCEQYVNLAYKLASDFNRTHIGEWEDFVSIAFIGLVKAAQKYDSERGASFGTFARIRINGELLDSVRSETHYRGNRDDKYNYDVKFTSLEDILSDMVRVSSDVSVEDDVLERMGREEIGRALMMLDERSRNILYWNYVMGVTNVEIAKRLGIGQSRVSQLTKIALKRMSEILKEEG